MRQAWVHDAIWWHLYPLGFVGAEPRELPSGRAVHRLGHIEAWLDYAVQLGATGLQLGPVFASSTHGYDTIDHFSIDRRLGDKADFEHLVAAARARGLRVLLDGVFNHVGRDFPTFRRVVATGPGATEAPWFTLRWASDWRPGSEPDYAHFEGHRALVTLNHREPAVSDYVVRVMTYWLARGIDGWRLDAAYAVPPMFWRDVLSRVRKKFPEAYFVGEVIHGDYSGFVRDAGVDALTQYELWKAIWSSLNDKNLFELAWALKRHNAFLERFVPLTFVGNHDVTRLASKLNDPKLLPHAFVVLLTVGGTPSIYAGDEQGFRGIKEERKGGDDAIRPAFPATAAELDPAGQPIFRLHQTLIALRRRNPWLPQAKTTELHLRNETMVYEVGSGPERLIVALNLGPGNATLPVPNACAVLAGSDRTQILRQGTDSFAELGGCGWAIMATST